MRTLLIITGAVLVVCALVVEKLNNKNGMGALEWIILIAGLLVVVIGMNMQ